LAEFTGERVIPGEVDADLWNEHLARYAFAARLSKRKRVLDLGCGAGYGSAELARTADSVLGIDQSEDAIEFARAHYTAAGVRFETGDCTSIPASDASFDLVVAFEVIEHVSEWRKLIEEARRVLSPGGQFIVSTPNKLYYAESRQKAGPNPFHVHEFEFQEFRDELKSFFPHVSLFLENHAEGVVFRPVEPDQTSEVRVDGVATADASHFFIAVCALRPQTGAPTFVYVPSAANVLRERERHIAKLEGELATKDAWLEKAKSDLAALNVDHQELLARYRTQLAELEQRAQWAAGLQRDIEQRDGRIVQLQQELAEQHAAALEVARGYEAKVQELEREIVRHAEATQQELDKRNAELAKCVDLLHEAEKTVEERTLWAQRLQTEVDERDRRITAISQSRWIRLGRKLGVGPVTGS
jgi:ubiquinone biosynthesis O-methyltransferase